MYAIWKDSKRDFKNMDCLLFMNGKSEDSVKIKTTVVYLWLLGYELLDSVLFFTKKSIVIIGGHKQTSLLSHFKEDKASSDFNVEII